MIEKDLSHLRFLCTRVQKGEILNSEDVAFMMEKRDYLNKVYISITEALEIQIAKENEL